MKEQRQYDPAERAAATAALLAGQSVTQVAKAYSIPKGTASAWKKRAFARAGKVDPATQKRAAADKIGELLTKYLESNLRALDAHARVFADETWIREQDAQQIAVLHGIMTDKAVRLLEALSAGGES